MKTDDFILSLELWQYKALEIITFFDNDSIERRASTFYNGYFLFTVKDLDLLDYVDFHIERTAWSRKILTVLTGFLFLIGAIFLLYGIWLVGIPTLTIPFLLFFLFENRKVRKNRMLMLAILNHESNRRRFFNSKRDRATNLFLHPGYTEDVESFKPIHLYSSFENELQEIALRENKFNKMPMPEVIEIFSLMCCPDVRRDCPQITKADLIYFLKAAFLKESIAGEKRKLSFISKTNENVRGLFYHFYFQSKQKGYISSDQSRDDYIGLLTGSFLGFNFRQVDTNFREKRNGKSFNYLLERQKTFD